MIWEIVALSSAGVYAAWEEIQLRRWTPYLFQHGVAIFRASIPVTGINLPRMPALPRTWLGWGAAGKLCSDDSIVFTAQVTNAPVMRGLLFVSSDRAHLTAVGRLHLGLYPILLVALALAQAAWFVWIGIAVYWVVSYVGEVRRFQRILAEAAREAKGLERTEEGPAQVSLSQQLPALLVAIVVFSSIPLIESMGGGVVGSVLPILIVLFALVTLANRPHSSGV